MGSPGGSAVKNLQCRRCGFDPRVGKISWRMKQQPTPVFLPGESHGQRSLGGYSPWGCQELDTTECARTKRRQERKERGFVFIQPHWDGQNLLTSPTEHKALKKKKKKIVSKNKEKKKNKQTKKAVLLIQPKRPRKATASSRRSARTLGGTSAWGAGSRVPPAEGREEQRAK